MSQEPSHHPPSTTDALRPARPWLPWVVALGLWLTLAVVVSASLWQLRRDIMAHQNRELELLALAMTDEVDRGLRGIEEGLYALRGELRDGRLSVSDPLASTHAMQVALGIRFQGRAGTPGGWILAALPASGALLGAFSAAQPGPQTRIAVFRSDGVRLASAHTDMEADADAARHGEPALAQRPGQEMQRFRDGSDNLVSLLRVPRYGVKVLVSINPHAALKTWRDAAEMAALVLALLLLTTVATLRFVQRAEHRRLQAQRAL